MRSRSGKQGFESLPATAKKSLGTRSESLDSSPSLSSSTGMQSGKQKQRALKQDLEATSPSPLPISSKPKTRERAIRLSYTGSSRPKCESCPLGKYREADPSIFVRADLRKWKPLLLGEAPGDKETEEGKGFVGPAGKVIWKILEGYGLSRYDFSVSNIIKCQPPENDFDFAGAKAIKACRAALDAEIKRSSPPFIVALGARALNAVADLSQVPRKTISELHGQKLSGPGGIPVLVSYHPAYFLHSKDERVFNALCDDLGEIVNMNGHHPRRGKKAVYTRVHPSILPIDVVLDIENPGDSIKLVGVSELRQGKAVWMYDEGSIPDFNPTERLIGHNIRYDYGALRKAGFIRESWPGRLEDTILLAQVLDENRESYSLKSFASEFGFDLYWTGIDFKEEIPIEKLTQYCANDVALTRALFFDRKKKLKEDPKLLRYYENFLCDALKLCAELELNGTQISKDAVKVGEDLKARVEEQKAKIREFVGDVKNVNATLLKRKVFFEDLALPVIRRTPKIHAPALDKQTLAELAQEDKTGIVQAYIDLQTLDIQRRDAEKLFESAGGLLHARFNLGAKGAKEEEKGSPVTGRLSSQEPNMQNFPGWIRKHFVSRFGKKGRILKWDAKQIELKVAYCYSRDPAFLIPNRHQMTADLLSTVNAFSLNEPDGRTFSYAEGKTANFAVIFGAEEEKIQNEFGVNYGVAQAFIHALRLEYPIHFAYVEELKKELVRTGRVRSLSGRIRRLPLAQHGSGYPKHHAINQGVNFGIQEFANVLNLLCAIDLGPRPESSVLWNLVHDEGDLDCPDVRSARKLAKRIRIFWSDILPERVKEVFGFELPATFEVEISMGKNWLEMEKIDA